jgi:hypothetical protein
MATATKSTKTTGKTPPTSPAPPPATETRVLPDGTIERYTNGRLIKTTPPPKANGKPSKLPAAAPQPPASLQAAVQATGEPKHYVGKLGTEDIWAFEVIKPHDQASPVLVRRFIGYDQQGADKRYAAKQADQLWRELLTERGYTWIDGQVHRLVDEDV